MSVQKFRVPYFPAKSPRTFGHCGSIGATFDLMSWRPTNPWTESSSHVTCFTLSKSCIIIVELTQYHYNDHHKLHHYYHLHQQQHHHRYHIYLFIIVICRIHPNRKIIYHPMHFILIINSLYESIFLIFLQLLNTCYFTILWNLNFQLFMYIIIMVSKIMTNKWWRRNESVNAAYYIYSI